MKETFEQWLERIAEIKPWNAQTEENPEWIDMYVSRIDGGYLCFSNLTDDIKWLYENGITEQIQKKSPDSNTCCIGFNPAEQKWYGWSHRATYGFGIGSEIKKTDLGYVPENKDRFLEWAAKNSIDTVGPYQLATEDYKQDGRLGVLIQEATPLLNQTGSDPQAMSTFYDYPATWGHGEWKAATLDDAKQMAIDFLESVG